MDIKDVLDILAAADRDTINAAFAQLEGEVPDIRTRVWAVVNYLADGGEHRPFWAAVIDGYRPAGKGND